MKDRFNRAADALVDRPIVARWRQRIRRLHHYRMTTQWSVPGEQECVASALLDSELLPQWWPQFLETQVIEPGDAVGLGRVVRVVTKGWMPHRLRFLFRITEVEYPNFFRLRIAGDFQGVGSGHLRQVGPEVTVDFDWNIVVRSRFLRISTPLLKLLFVNNHHWLMKQGERNMRLGWAAERASHVA